MNIVWEIIKEPFRAYKEVLKQKESPFVVIFALVFGTAGIVLAIIGILCTIFAE